MTILYAALFGAAFGSFANAAIDRIPRGRSLNGRSSCDGCGRALHAWELVPIASYVLLRGRCATCHAQIGPRSPAVEAISALAFACAFALLPVAAAISACAMFTLVSIAAGVAIERRGVQR